MATVVVFADLVGSTRIFERLGDETASRFITNLTAELSRHFQEHSGRVVKLLGDGLFVLFPGEAQALGACVAIQRRLARQPVLVGGDGLPIQMQMGMESGEVVEIDGDCFGDAVNSAARLADLAGAEQILTTQRVHAALPVAERRQLRSLGPMHLRGKSTATEIFRVHWRAGEDDDATVMGVSVHRAARASATVELRTATQALRLDASASSATLGRALGCSLVFNDGRVSRLHATLEWRAEQLVLCDTSSFGTWVYMGDQGEPVVLRRTECFLVGHGMIALGCDRQAEGAPTVAFSVRG